MDKVCFKTQKGPAAVGPYNTAVIYGDTVYMSGMIGIDPAVQKPVEGGTLAQAAQILKKIEEVLGDQYYGFHSAADEAREEVTLYECYTKIDINGKITGLF